MSTENNLQQSNYETSFSPYHLYSDESSLQDSSSAKKVPSTSQKISSKQIDSSDPQAPSTNASLKTSSSSVKASKGSSKKYGSAKRSLQPDQEFTFSWDDFVQNNFYISSTWSLDYYYTMRGSESFHMYLWIAKDFFWAQNNEYCAYIFGCLAVAWCFVLLYYAIHAKNIEEVYLWVPNSLWVIAAFVWMAGEVTNGDDDYVAPRSAVIMGGAIAMILVYHIIFKPLGFFTLPENFQESHYGCPDGLQCRFSYFETWRSYENAHTFCWLAIDLCWNRGWTIPWILFLIPTFFIAVDFIWTTFRTKNMMEETVHYVTQLLWIVGNVLWTIGNFFVNEDGDDDANYVITSSRASDSKMRYYSSWFLLASFFPLIVLYCAWIPLTYMGKLPQPDPEDYYQYPQFNEEGIKPTKSPAKQTPNKGKMNPDDDLGL